MDKDIRLYVYNCGTLVKKLGKLKHNYKTIEDCEKAIKEDDSKFKNGIFQYVVTEYTGVYSSNIVKLIEKNYTNGKT